MPMVVSVFEKHEPARFIIPWKAADAGGIDFKGARDMHIDVSMFPILNAQGELTNVVCQWVDITERKKSEEALEKYREHLEDLVRERTIKLEASNNELEAFSYSASHDLRAPLRTIDGFSQAILEDCEDKLNIQGKDYLIRIRAATKRMADLIEDLLQLSRIARTELNIEKINLTRIARSIIDEWQKSQPQRHVEIKIADGLEDAADSRLMRITLDNLLGNAWKFTEKQAKAVIEFGCTKEGGKKVYFIRDNGAGFDMAYADKLFAPFQRLHNEEEFPGTGIGLALVRRIIHRHGGKVWTEGQAGKGATFYFSLH
jgi:light-regulated signal transduction histidine kinase (bacteriophytochrome)